MLTIKSYPFLLSIGIGLLFWYGNHFFEGPEWVQLILLNMLQASIGLLSTYWILKRYQKSDPFRLFWLFLGLGTSFSVLGTFAWIVLLGVQQAVFTSEVSYFIWMFSYLFYFIALINQLMKHFKKFLNATFFFNTTIFMVASVSISYHYLLYPLFQNNQHALLSIVFTFLFQIADIGILFFIITLYYLIRVQKQSEFLIYLIIGLFLQIIGDSIFAQMTIDDSYVPGGIVDFDWTIALLFIGCTAHYYEAKTTPKKVMNHSSLESIVRDGLVFPYASILVLSILVIQSYNWMFNALSTGWLIIFLLVIIRQIFTVTKNNKLLFELKQTAYIDSLTGLGNRASFIRETNKRLNDAQVPLAFILLQVKRVRMFTDIFGYLVGEQIIKEVSLRLSNLEDMNLKVYRFSEDEFMIVLPTIEKLSIVRANERIFSHLTAPIALDDLELNIFAYSGISTFPDQSQTVKEVQSHAAEALYQAKKFGNHTFVFYETELQSNLVRKFEIEANLRHAIREQQLSVYYQPKVNLCSGKVIGMEALLRWHHPKFGWISPAEFIPVAEESGLINEIGEWVLHTATEQSKQLQLLGFEPLLLSVNVSALQFQTPNFCKRVTDILQKTRLDPQWLELEITESIVQNIKESVSILQCLKNSNIKTSIDDFGTGYSSLNVLEQLPIDTLKIDKSFIDRLMINTNSPMVKTIIELGLNLDLTIVAEGVETMEQKEILEAYGCTIGQGYLFSRPIDFDSFIAFLRTKDSAEIIPI